VDQCCEYVVTMFFTSSCCSLLVVPFTLFPRERGFTATAVLLVFELSRIGIPHHEIILIYCAIIRSVLEYACAVWHSGLTTAQSLDIERVQLSVVCVFFPLICLILMHYSYLDLNALLRDEKGLFVILLRIFN
jgi:hypothetical protein